MKVVNLYYRTMYRRTHYLKEMSLVVFVFVISWPRILLEVFIRKNFGRRYFSFFKAIVISAFLIAVSLAYGFAANFYHKPTIGGMIASNISFYICLGAFLYFCYKRNQEVKHEAGVYDFDKFTHYNGDIDDRFFKVKIMGKVPTRRQVCILVEPAFFLIIGFVFAIVGQKVGPLIIFCSICYSLGYLGEYVRGDHFIMDKIDEMICSQELVESFVNNTSPSDTRGFEAIGNRPVNPEFRRKVAEAFFDNEPVDEVF